jgi:transposase
MKKVITFAGMDAHKVSIKLAVLLPDSTKPVEWETANEKSAVRRMVRKVQRLAAGGEIRFCYEAGPCGYALQRWIREAGAECVVVAPSLIPRKPGDRIKTDRRDARKLAELLRAGLLTEVHAPTVEDEAVRDLCRAREDAHEDLVRCRHRASKMLLRRGWIWNGTKKAWGQAHRLWLRSLRLRAASRPGGLRQLPAGDRSGRRAPTCARSARRGRQPTPRLRRSGGRAALLPWHRHPYRHGTRRRAARLHSL